ncbi:hypothetical protein MLD38_000519 [Melastoma candidum]|uniref:Uncharacterized protein n=1 Tax=Melastoma candidum TaxID=119954 RepID=A0ACB9SAT4_9MYRT|nr:hypothetical protein MLD38_000519 [Melastoma candidum]
MSLLENEIHNVYPFSFPGCISAYQEIAVKRLSKKPGQGLEDFMSEVVLIARLKHKNLVGLVGCCIEKTERMLIYEYMPNKCWTTSSSVRRKSSFSAFLTLFIVCGIAHGLVYHLHGSKLPVVHRDLKPSNLLLDGDLNLKISDFGLANTGTRHYHLSANNEDLKGEYFSFFSKIQQLHVPGACLRGAILCEVRCVQLRRATARASVVKGMQDSISLISGNVLELVEKLEDEVIRNPGREVHTCGVAVRAEVAGGQAVNGSSGGDAGKQRDSCRSLSSPDSFWNKQNVIPTPMWLLP